MQACTSDRHSRIAGLLAGDIHRQARGCAAQRLIDRQLAKAWWRDEGHIQTWGHLHHTPVDPTRAPSWMLASCRVCLECSANYLPCSCTMASNDTRQSHRHSS